MNIYRQVNTLRITIIFIFTFCILFLILNCNNKAPVLYTITTESSISSVIIPEIEVSDGGLVPYSGSTRGVWYFNSLHTKEESDIQLDDGIRHSQKAVRYMRVAGKAIPDDLDNPPDRRYHSALFAILHEDYWDIENTEERMSHSIKFSIPVDSDDLFNGHIYFPSTGSYKVYSFRAIEDILYPRSQRGSTYSVLPTSSTLVFYVTVTEAVPAALWPLVPSRNTDCDTISVREKALAITADCTDDYDVARTVYEFLVFGEDDMDVSDDFLYTEYALIYPDYLSTSYNDIFIASHFLASRKGVCNDFAELYAALMRSLGYKVKKREGYQDPGLTSGHMWNILYLDGGPAEGLRIDSTWGNQYKGTYKEYAELYPEFDGSTFYTQHDLVFIYDLKTDY